MNPKSLANLKNLSREIKPDSRNTIIFDAIKASGSRGETSASLAELCGCTKNGVLGAIACLNTQRRYVYASGPQAMRRYFASQSDADAYAPLGQRLRDQLVKETQRRAMKRRNERRAKKAGKPAPTERAKNAYVVVRGRDAPVKVPGPTRAALAAANVKVPEGLLIQVGPAWTHDPRYQVPPGQRVVGEFTAEWRQRRSA